MAKTERIRLEDIELEPKAQPRARMSTEVVDEYAERMQHGDQFPPLRLAFIPGDHADRLVLISGWHRYEAMRKLGLEDAECQTIQCETIEDAIIESCKENTAHGLRRSNEDKRHVVRTLLGLDQQKSDNWIAEICGVSHTFVGILRRELDAASDVRIGKDGMIRVYPGSEPPAAATAQSAEPEEAPPTRKQEYIDPNSIQFKMSEAIYAFNQLDSKAQGLEAAVEEFLQDDISGFISTQALRSDLRTVRSTIGAGKPFKVCPLCDGDKCRTCRMLGWVSKQQWSLIPEDQRQ